MLRLNIERKNGSRVINLVWCNEIPCQQVKLPNLIFNHSTKQKTNTSNHKKKKNNNQYLNSTIKQKPNILKLKNQPKPPFKRESTQKH